MKIRYKPLKNLTRDTRKIVDRSNVILDEYEAQGFVLTLRQLFYQHVARGWIPNKQKSYKRLGKIVGDARLTGLIGWDRIEDRTRRLKLLQHFSGPDDALNKLASWYHVDLWAQQAWRPEVWIEKDALAGVIEGVCQENDVPYFSCRGYTSLSEMWRAGERLKGWGQNGQKPFVIHFGDHDPSGMDMSRDIIDRLRETFGASFDFQRVALNMAQIEQYTPPPNPAKVTDSRYKVYLEKYGDESWELDALEPSVFRTLITERLDAIRDAKQWEKDVKEKERVRKQLQELAGDWGSVGANKKLVAKQGKELAELASKLEKAEGDLKKERDRKRRKPPSQ